MFQSTKVIDGFSTCFRQHAAEGTHCRFLHGYSISFKIVFQGDLDERNWTFDFGGLKRAKATIDGMSPDAWFKHMFDHTVVISEDDPHWEEFKHLDDLGAIQLRMLPKVGCEMFAKYVFDKLSDWLYKEIGSYRVTLKSVECFEHSKNSAIYSER